MFVRIGVAAKILGVCTKTLRRWETRGIIIPHRTAGKHRRYHKGTLEQFKVTGVYELQQADPEAVAIYARVSSSRQKEDLKRQLTFLREHPRVTRAKKVYEYSDIASGLNDTRPRRQSTRLLLKPALISSSTKIYRGCLHAASVVVSPSS